MSVKWLMRYWMDVVDSSHRLIPHVISGPFLITISPPNVHEPKIRLGKPVTVTRVGREDRCYHVGDLQRAMHPSHLIFPDRNSLSRRRDDRLVHASRRSQTTKMPI